MKRGGSLPVSPMAGGRKATHQETCTARISFLLGSHPYATEYRLRNDEMRSRGILGKSLAFFVRTETFRQNVSFVQDPRFPSNPAQPPNSGRARIRASPRTPNPLHLPKKKKTPLFPSGRLPGCGRVEAVVAGETAIRRAYGSTQQDLIANKRSPPLLPLVRERARCEGRPPGPGRTGVSLMGPGVCCKKRQSVPDGARRPQPSIAR